MARILISLSMACLLAFSWLLLYFLYDICVFRGLYCACLATLLRTAAIRRLSPVSRYYYTGRGRYCCPGRILRQKSCFQVIELFNFDLLRRAFFSFITLAFFCGVFYKEFSPRTSRLEEAFSAGPKYHSTFSKRPLYRFLGFNSHFYDFCHAS